MCDCVHAKEANAANLKKQQKRMDTHKAAVSRNEVATEKDVSYENEVIIGLIPQYRISEITIQRF